MKFSDYYLAPASRIVATFFGVISGVAVGLFTGWQYGVLAGAAVAILASVLLPLKVYLEERPYHLIKEKIEGPILIDQRVRFSIKGGSLGGYFILTEKRMIFLSLEDGEHRLEFSHADVSSVVIGNDMSVRIFLKNEKQFVRMMSNMVDEIGEVLRQNGWQVRVE